MYISLFVFPICIHQAAYEVAFAAIWVIIIGLFLVRLQLRTQDGLNPPNRSKSRYNMSY